MAPISRPRSMTISFFFLFFSILLQFLSGFSDDSNPQENTKVDDRASSRRENGSTIILVCIALAAVVGLSAFLFKLWQKKKREEQYARLLRLFEEDDELELELGLRD
ncbi:hypothetical protein Ccrd_018656 [Cynara cardunculus var. scolymus]|uniref:Transmembrane protein n=1 Tax=Cynara cardunculus var. scolymus TaxID=59895 RepID=A0A103Y5T5_CYNCS|nr:hypothetical protein Ccrd_018656 [Cynara cardunculus var. scolymus]